MSEARELPTGCAYIGAGGKSLIASVFALRPGYVDFDDMQHTRGAQEAKGIDGADGPGVFHPLFSIMAALKGDVMASVQTPALQKEGEKKVEKVTQSLLEKLLAQI